MLNDKKIVLAGHICLDITPVFLSNKVSKVEQVLSPGKLINIGAANISAGGSVANTGLAMKFFGIDVSLMGKGGDDIFGQSIIDILKKHSAEKDLLIDKASTTSYSLVMALPGIDRIFLHHPGANDTFCSQDIGNDKLDGVDLFHFGYPPLMKNMYKDSGSEIINLFKRVKSKGVVTSLDMAAVDAESGAGKQDWKKIIKNLIPYVDFFMPSIEEICFMLNRGKYEQLNKLADGRDLTEILSIEKDVEPLGEMLIDMGAKVVVIKCGALGIYYHTSSAGNINKIKNGFLYESDMWADKKGFEKSFKPNRILSGTGAGDVTIAAFLSAIVKQYPIEKCIKIAAAAGTSSLAEYDPLSGLKTIDELEIKINNGWEKSW